MSFFKPKFWDKNQISFYSILLLPIAAIYKLLFFLKKKITKTHKVSIPIICIGNIYLGGTGKTPLSVEIFLILKKLNMEPAFIRKKHESYSDEENLQKNIGVVFSNKSRLQAINEATKNNVNIGILDDGFQDFSINKDLNIICFDEKKWIGNNFVLPAGPLREELTALKRADCVVIKGRKNINIENEIIKINSSIKIFYANYKPQNINEFKNEKVIAFAGIGNPESFFQLLKDNNISIFEEAKFPDHYNYSPENLDILIKKAEENKVILITTEKDYYRIDKNYRKKFNFLKVSFEINDKNKFLEEIKKIV
jgi:tetraacyldisaccharide 4'-kinase